MKVAFILGPFSIGNRPLNLFAENFWISSRGATGTEVGIIAHCLEWSKNHDVSLFTIHVPDTKPDKMGNVKLHYYYEAAQIIDDTFDAIISWNEPDVFRGLPEKPLRVVYQMLNDFTYCAPSYDDFVDVWVSPCEMHKSWLTKLAPKPEKWQVCPLGADPSWYSNIEKNKGSCAWISSVDRGAHLILECWPKIKQMVPEATLKVFYHISDSGLEKIEPTETHIHPNTLRLAHRLRYIKYALPKLKHLGVEHIGSVSRKQIAEELSKTSVLICPLSTVSETEGFSCSTLEGLMAGCFPIVGNIDCLGSIYGKVVSMIPAPVENNKEILINSVIKALTDKKWHAEITAKCKTWAAEYTWEKSAKKLETIIKNHPKFQK